MVNRGDSRGMSTIIATLLIIIITFVAVAIIWIVIRNVIQNSAEEISLGKLTLNLEIKGVLINPAFPNNLSVKVKRSAGKGDMSGIKFILDDGENTEIVELSNYSMGELEEKTISINLSEISNSSNIKKVSIAPIFMLESGKEVTGDIKDEYKVIKTSASGGTPCTPNCAGRVCGPNGCGGYCPPNNCGTGYTCNTTTGQCVAISTCTPATCGTKECGTWANGTCAGTLVCGSYGGGCQSGYTCNTTTGQCVAQTRVWTNELVINGGFEWNNLTGWTTSGSYWHTTTGAYPTTNWTTGSANGTYHAYTANGADSNSYLYQDVNISAYATSIDAGIALVNASGWGISFEIPPQDWTRIQIFFLYSNGSIISTPVNTGNKGIQPWWRAGVFNYPVPINTRYVRVWGNTYESGYGSGALDDFSVRVGYLT